jgi:hypothetical protein
MSSGLPPENGHDQQTRHDRYADTGPDVTGEIEQPGAVGPLLGRKGCEGDGQRDNHHTAEAEPGHAELSPSRGAMNGAYLSAIAALAGPGIGAVASFATTWLTQDAQSRAQRLAQAMTRRERLYGEFIEEASRLFTDAITHQLDDPSKFVRLYALVEAAAVRSR